ncbi:hypothetical protein [Tsukamurella paurometabola]|uniref:Lipoprotein n=1 Tax=Tsukamurella paurometabola TaxID=2061 RepID=A0A3P8L8W1_TSUPA|nr:hypothetical protein [Tsukamurella paurometabola]UEA83288.1 hypothetical protein LK411_00040 [Tsukamurella paurometabola]VDR40391.1 Uncharacterised protein [Tsukamurella paurometabola]
MRLGVAACVVLVPFAAACGTDEGPTSVAAAQQTNRCEIAAADAAYRDATGRVARQRAIKRIVQQENCGRSKPGKWGCIVDEDVERAMRGDVDAPGLRALISVDPPLYGSIAPEVVDPARYVVNLWCAHFDGGPTFVLSGVRP